MTGGAGTICSAQTRALVALGANACIIGRNPQKTEAVASDIATARDGAKVIGIGGCDVRDVRGGCHKPPFRSVQIRTTLTRSAAGEFEERRGKMRKGTRSYRLCHVRPSYSYFLFMPRPDANLLNHRAGAAGNFVAPIAGLSSNAFKAVMDIDVLGTFNTVKATMPYLVESAARNPNPSQNGLTGGRILYVSATFHYIGMPLQAHVSAAKASVDSIMASVALEVRKFQPASVSATHPFQGLQRGFKGFLKCLLQGTNTDMFDSTVHSGLHLTSLPLEALRARKVWSGSRAARWI